MAIELKHATQATVPDAGTGEIGTTEWNEGHTLSGTSGTMIAFGISGDAEEVTKPDGDLVGTTETQTLSNKTLTGAKHTVYTLTGTTPSISGDDGFFQLWTLTANSTPTDGMANGEMVRLLIDDGAGFSITWTMVDVWETSGGTAPALKATGRTPIDLYKVDDVVYGVKVGTA